MSKNDNITPIDMLKCRNQRRGPQMVLVRMAKGSGAGYRRSLESSCQPSIVDILGRLLFRWIGSAAFGGTWNATPAEPTLVMRAFIAAFRTMHFREERGHMSGMRLLCLRTWRITARVADSEHRKLTSECAAPAISSPICVSSNDTKLWRAWCVYAGRHVGC